MELSPWPETANAPLAAHADAEQRAQHQEGGVVGRQSGKHLTDGKEHQVDHQWKPAAVTVGKQAKEESAYRPKHQRRGDGKRDGGVRLVKLFSDRGEAQRDEKEIEGVQRPPQKSGCQRGTMIGSLVQGRSIAIDHLLEWYSRLGQRMNGRRASCWLGCGFVFLGALYAFQKPFRQFPGVEYFSFELTPDWQEKGEWAFARLMFPPGPTTATPAASMAISGEAVALDAGLSARRSAFLASVRRLTRLHVRSVEQPILLEDGDDVYNWPWLYAVQVGEWGFTEEEAKVMREYLLRGGFFMADDFHGDYEWEMFLKRIRFVFPDRPIVDIPEDDPIFHTVSI